MVQVAKPRTIEVTVNNKPVQLTVEQGKPEMTGREIKAAAIAQGVNIRADFMLFVLKGQEFEPVDDDETVVVHEKLQFRAVTPDDNS